MATTFTLASVTSDELELIVEDITRSILNVSSNTTEIPGRRGHVYEGNQIGAKKFSFTCSVDTQTEAARVEIGNELASFFTQLSNGNLYTLELTDEPNVFYWVYPTNISDMTRIGEGYTQGTFTFDLIAPEGVSYGKLIEFEMPSSTGKITHDGNVATPPVLVLNTTERLQRIAVSNGGEYIHMSRATIPPESAYYLNDECNDLTPWSRLQTSTISFDLQDGVIANDADMSLLNAHKIIPTTYGTNPNGVQDRTWYGPARRRNFGKRLADYEVWFSIEFMNYYPRSFNKFELNLLDEYGQRAARLWIKDEGISQQNLIGVELFKDGNRRQIGLSENFGLNKTIDGVKRTTNVTIKRKLKEVDIQGSEEVGSVISKKYELKEEYTTNAISNFIGTIGLRKVGKRYTAMIQFMDVKGNPYGKLYEIDFTDQNNEFGQSIAGMTMFFGKKNIYEDEGDPPVPYKGNDVSVRHIRVKELTEQGPAVVGYVAEPGDEIIIDCGNKKVYKNGSVFMQDLHIGSKFFTLAPSGQVNTLSFEPSPSRENQWTLMLNPRRS